MICPQCDGILNIRGCMSCGWQHGDAWPNSRLTPDSVHPLKLGADYPLRPLGISGTPIVLKNYGQLIVVPDPITLTIPERPETLATKPVATLSIPHAKIHDFGSGNWAFHCLGCGHDHSFRVSDDTSRPQWTWNGSLDKPTFKPSLLINKHDPSSRCHSFVTDGRIEFLGDCFHNLKNQTVDLPDWEEEFPVTESLKQIDSIPAEPEPVTCCDTGMRSGGHAHDQSCPESPGLDKGTTRYAVGTLTDDDGEPSGHVLVGPIPNTPTNQTEAIDLPAIPDPLTKSVQ